MTAALAGAFALTIVLETAVATAILRRFVWLEALLIQCATWPFAQLLVGRTGHFWSVELGVAVAETLFWRMLLPVSWRKAALVSVAANGTTILAGILLFRRG